MLREREIKLKKLITIVLIIASIFSYLTLFDNENILQFSKMQGAEYENYTYRILIPSTVTNQSQEQVYKKITAALNKYKANIYYNRVGKETDNIVYTYFTDNEYFKNFIITKGRPLSLSENDSKKFLSLKHTGDINQVGEIADFGGDNSFEIHTLKDMLGSKQMFNGYCYIQFTKNPQISDFIDDVSASLGCTIQAPLPTHNVLPKPYLIYIMVIIFYFIIMLLVLYDLLKSYKKIGIKKMQGYSTRKIWISKVSSLIAMQSIIFFAVTCLLSLFKVKEFNELFWLFLLKLFIINIVVAFISLVVCSIPFIYVNKITVSNMIKNRQPIKVITVLNIIIKIVLMVAFVIIVNEFIQNFNRIQKEFTHSYGQWEATKNYAIIPSFENIDINYTITDEYNKKAKEIYEYFNKKGAILADFAGFHAEQRAANLKPGSKAWELDWINVNPNYLDKQLIYDNQGKVVNISETEKDYTVLIPEKYKSSEDIIRKQIEFVKRGYPPEDSVPKEAIKIIWIKSNQRIFSYDMDVNSNDGNMVKNAFVRVVTEANASKFDYMRVAICAGNPFKIKVDNPSNPGATILPKLKDVKLDIYSPSITSVYDIVGAQINQTKSLARTLAIEIIMSAAFIVIIILQNVYNFFQVNKQRLVVQQFHGYKKIHKYKEYFLSIIFSWVIIFNLVIIMKKINFSELAKYTTSINMVNTLVLTIIFAAIELLISLILLNFVEKIKIVNTIKRS